MKMKVIRHRFTCDTCGEVAGEADIESEALKNARQTASREGWKWSHPGWGLTCPACRINQPPPVTR